MFWWWSCFWLGVILCEIGSVESHKIEEKNFVEQIVHETFGAEYAVWCNAIVATTIIGCMPVLILSFLPSSVHNNPRFMKILLAFAVGGLLGDVFLHLIPHAMDPHHHHEHEHDHDHHHDHDHDHHHHEHEHDHHHHHHHGHEHHDHDHSQSNYVGLWVLGGIISFLMIEKFVHILHGEGGGHGHSHGKKDDSKKKKKQEKEKTMSPVAAYLNLAADFCHNMTDGLAIGASFKASYSLGLVTTFAVLLHELPHEIGDFAILVQAGFSKREAMVAQLYTAIGALAGTVIGLMAEGQEGAAWILPFTAGGFIYIACTSVLPSLLNDESLEFKQSIFEFLAIALGIILMLFVGLFE
mmetsp:Transcript_43971/g.61799  ORF Transcript_43971/g.61799 Transcript_43971/m.61799 type:complete len:353 (-) Transcript_43971:88-1146(-)